MSAAIRVVPSVSFPPPLSYPPSERRKDHRVPGLLRNHHLAESGKGGEFAQDSAVHPPPIVSVPFEPRVSPAGRDVGCVEVRGA
jgi:hypothetical protein